MPYKKARAVIILNKNINSTWNNLKDFTDLQFIAGNQSIEINSLGPNIWMGLGAIGGTRRA